ncbi:hypothetical protein C7M84_010012 [Penaeus vannamei]|uniref:Uncharacterized protein n=1 Tax=Penaeus vannamei TaxID=6689 RepID=A0A3R7QLY7_PENVA|nr:hypothetical protein C7M84_010012 [Penaeus vannamei]
MSSHPLPYVAVQTEAALWGCFRKELRTSPQLRQRSSAQHKSIIMSGKMKQRSAVNTAESATVSVNEKILRECHSLYTEPDNGLVAIGESLGLKLLPPRKKINVMLMGNHSAGKSSFINW